MLVVDQSVSSGCTNFLPIEQPYRTDSRLQSIEYVLGVQSVWNATGLPSVIIENTYTTYGTTDTSFTIKGLAASTIHSFVVAAINAVGIGANGARSTNATTTSPTIPSQVTPMPTTTNVSTTSMTLNWLQPEGNGLRVSGYRIDAKMKRKEIQNIWLNVDYNPSTAGTNGGMFKIQMDTNDYNVQTACIAWDSSSEDMLNAFQSVSWTLIGTNGRTNAPYSVVNVTRRNNHFSIEHGYVWAVTFSDASGDVPQMNVTDVGCTPTIQSIFTQTGGLLQSQTIVDGFIERTQRMYSNTGTSSTTKWMNNLYHGAMYSFSVSAIHAVGVGSSSAYSIESTDSTTLTSIPCLMQEWNEWSQCETLYNSKKQCGK